MVVVEMEIADYKQIALELMVLFAFEEIGCNEQQFQLFEFV